MHVSGSSPVFVAHSNSTRIELCLRAIRPCAGTKKTWFCWCFQMEVSWSFHKWGYLSYFIIDNHMKMDDLGLPWIHLWKLFLPFSVAIPSSLFGDDGPSWLVFLGFPVDWVESNDELQMCQRHPVSLCFELRTNIWTKIMDQLLSQSPILWAFCVMLTMSPPRSSKSKWNRHLFEWAYKTQMIFTQKW